MQRQALRQCLETLIHLGVEGSPAVVDPQDMSTLLDPPARVMHMDTLRLLVPGPADLLDVKNRNQIHHQALYMDSVPSLMSATVLTEENSGCS